MADYNSQGMTQPLSIIKPALHLLDNPGSHAGVNEKSSLDAKTYSSDVLPDLGLFGNVFDLLDGGAIDGNTVMNELLFKPSWTSAYENNKLHVKFPVGFGTQYTNMAQVSGVTSEVQGYAAYPNGVSQFNTSPLPINESSGGSSGYYQRRVEELTSSIYQTEGMLYMTQAINGSMQAIVNSLRSENESLKSYYTMSCAGYNNLFADLTRAKEHLSKKVTMLEREKVGLRRDLEWVMRKAIPRMLAKVLRSEQFDNEILKVQKMFIARGRDLGRQVARDLLMSNQRLSAFDPDLPRKAKDVVRGLKKIKWESWNLYFYPLTCLPTCFVVYWNVVIAPRVKDRAADVLSKDLSYKLSDLDVCLCYLIAKFSM
ncbi:hypothetical protein Tco_1442095 [Tanacetum coccineum]